MARPRKRKAVKVKVKATRRKKRKYTRRAKASQRTTIRGQLLDDAKVVTEGDRNDAYGDPIFQFSTAATLKMMFWQAFDEATERLPENQRMARDVLLGRNSAHGEALEMIFTKLARIASSPSSVARRDTYLDEANYFAIAYEVAEQTREGAQGLGVVFFPNGIKITKKK